MTNPVTEELLNIKKVSKESMDINQEQLEKLKQILPHVFTEGKIDFDKLRIALGDKVVTDERYSFNWLGREKAFKTLQKTEKGTLIPEEEESINFNTTQNLFIEGDNLKVMKLLYKSYFGKIKLIYIDPPYNTGSNLVYYDNYTDTIDSYIENVGDVYKKNPETNGRFHSDWITMMYPRLFMAHKLLKDDGVIFVSISDKEVHNLRMIMNEIFGEENFIETICHKHRASISNDKIISSNHNYVLLYAKNYDKIDKNRDQFGLEPNLDGFNEDDENGKGKYKFVPVDGPGGARKGNPFYEFMGVSGYFRVGKKTMQELYDKGEVVKSANSLKKKYYLENAKNKRKTDNTWWHDGGLGSEATKKLNELMGNEVFNNPKPVELITRMLRLWTHKNEEHIILDFFAGSGTTAQAVLELNEQDNVPRKFILIQCPEEVDENSEAHKEGYETIADICKERIRRVIKNIENENQEKLTKKDKIGFKVFKYSKSNFKIWEEHETENAQELTNLLQFFKDSLIDDYRDIDIIYECMLKEGYNLNSKIEATDINSNNILKVFDENRYFFICLDDKIEDKTFDELRLEKDNLFICLDKALDDSKKVNLSLQCNLKVI